MGILVEKEGHLLELARYVVLNPVRAGVVKHPRDYRWSSYRATAGEEAPASFLTIDWILSQFDANLKRARAAYSRFVMEGLGVRVWEDASGGFLLGTESMGSDLVSCIKKQYSPPMARPLRIEFEGALYHVTSRGNARQAIFLDDEDRERFLERLGKVVDRFGWLCHAYCLMTNHYHLLLETPAANLSRGMQLLNGTFTQAFNRRHGRVGHVLQGRFKGILVEKESHLLELARYVVLNPVRAGVVRHPREYGWSSYSSGSDLVLCGHAVYPPPMARPLRIEFVFGVRPCIVRTCSVSSTHGTSVED